LRQIALLVKCRQEGCNALIGGHDIPIFDLDFDVFAERSASITPLSAAIAITEQCRYNANSVFLWLGRNPQ